MNQEVLNREQIKDFAKRQFFKSIKENFQSALDYVIVTSYNEGYNMVLETAWNVLDREDYSRIIDKLEEMGV